MGFGIDWKRAVTLGLTLSVAFGVCFFSSACATLNKMEQERLLKLDSDENVYQADMSLPQLIENMQMATDPKGIYKNAKSFVMRQKITSEKELEKGKTTKEYETELKYKAPDWVLQTSSENNVPFSILLIRGEDAWTIEPVRKTAKKIPEGFGLELVKNFLDMSRPDTTVLDIFSEVTLSICYEGKQKFYRMVCRSRNPDIAPYVIYVDAKTYLTVKVETIMYAEDGSQTLYSCYSDQYEWVEGVCVARATVIVIDKKKDICLLTEYRLNVDLPDSDFELPKNFDVTGRK